MCVILTALGTKELTREELNAACTMLVLWYDEQARGCVPFVFADRDKAIGALFEGQWLRRFRRGGVERIYRAICRCPMHRRLADASASSPRA